MTPENAKKAYDITVKMPNVHGAPVHMGDAAEVGVADVMKPDYGEAVDFYEGEIPVFWPCGVTPQAAAAAEESLRKSRRVIFMAGVLLLCQIQRARTMERVTSLASGERSKLPPSCAVRQIV